MVVASAVQLIYIQTLHPQLTMWGTLDKLLNLSRSQFLHMQSGNKKVCLPYLLLCMLNIKLHMNHLEQCMALSKCSINVM